MSHLTTCPRANLGHPSGIPRKLLRRRVELSRTLQIVPAGTQRNRRTPRRWPAPTHVAGSAAVAVLVGSVAEDLQKRSTTRGNRLYKSPTQEAIGIIPNLPVLQ